MLAVGKPGPGIVAATQQSIFARIAAETPAIPIYNSVDEIREGIVNDDATYKEFNLTVAGIKQTVGQTGKTVTYEVLQIKHPSMQQAEGCVANSNESATKQLLCIRHPFCTTDCENQTKPKAGRRTLTIEEGTMIHNVLNVDDHLEAMRKIAYLKSMSK